MLVGKHIIGLSSCEVTEYKQSKNSILCTADFDDGMRDCIHGCGKTCRVKETKSRTVFTGHFDGISTKVKLSFKKLHCKLCKKSFHQRITGLLPRARISESFKNYLFTLHSAGCDISALSNLMGLSPNTIENVVSSRLDLRMKETDTRRLVCPTELGIDEHFFSKKDGFATTFVDLKKNQVFDVTLGRSEKSLESFLKKLRGKEAVKIVAMDLSDTYRSIVKKHFPNAKIIADRFHVVRVAMQSFQRLWHSIDGSVKWQRGLGKLFRMHSWNLDSEQTSKLQKYLNDWPSVERIYEKRNEICKLLTLKNQRGFQIRKNVTAFLNVIAELEDSGFSQLNTLAQTLKDWQEEIGRMWHSSKNNGVTEGFHNKMEVISRRAFGYRNFNNYRRRVLAMSGWNGVHATRTQRSRVARTLI
jgi:transposase